MSYQELLDDIKELPEEGYEELVQYVAFLNYKFKGKRIRNKRQIGGMRGKLKYMADDFDAPLDDFKEYM